MKYIGITILICFLFACSKRKEIIINKDVSSPLFENGKWAPVDLKNTIWRGGINNSNVVRSTKLEGISENQNTRDYKDSLKSCFCLTNKDTLNLFIQKNTGFVYHAIRLRIVDNKLVTAETLLDNDTGDDTIYDINKVRLELKDLKTKVGDTLFGKIKTEGKGGWQGYNYDETTEGYFKCIIKKK